MNTERITVTAADLQPGDTVVRGPWLASALEGSVVWRATSTVWVNDRYFDPDTEFTVDRPVPTATLTFDVPESKREAVEQAVQQVLAPPVKVGDRVRRTLPRGPGDGARGWELQPGVTGKVVGILSDGSIAVEGDGPDDDNFGWRGTWRANSFEVVPS